MAITTLPKEALLALEGTGLTRNEALVYAALLEGGPSTAARLAQGTQIHRINVYDITERLKAKGIISTFTSGRTKYYRAMPPEAIMAAEKNRLDELAAALPALKAVELREKTPLDAEVFIGKKAVKNAIDEVTRIKTEALLFATGWGFDFHYPAYRRIWYDKLIKNHVRVRALLGDKYAHNTPRPLVAAVLPSHVNFPSTTFVYGDNVLLINWQAREPVAVRIRSPEISGSYREYFELLWRISRKKATGKLKPARASRAST